MLLESFNFSYLKPNSTVLIYGAIYPLNCEIIKQFIYRNLDIPAHIIVSQKDSYYQFFSDFISNTFIYDSYSKTIYKNIISRHELLPGNLNKKSVLVIDEYSPFRKSKSIHKIIYNHKKYDITLIITHNYPTNFYDAMNTHMDFVFLEFVYPIHSRKKYFQSYGKFVFDSYEFFCSILDHLNLENEKIFGICSTYLVIDLKQLKYWKLHLFH